MGPNMSSTKHHWSCDPPRTHTLFLLHTYLLGILPITNGVDSGTYSLIAPRGM